LLTTAAECVWFLALIARTSIFCLVLTVHGKWHPTVASNPPARLFCRAASNSAGPGGKKSLPSKRAQMSRHLLRKYPRMLIHFLP
ncbi:hypothetical protein HDV62DRAFT_375745, partial [Trichoderma sp. SZMC 28011]